MKKKKVVFAGKHRKLAWFVGTEEECRAWIMRQASGSCLTADGKLRVGVIEHPDGDIYDVGCPIMYQIVDADGNDEKGLEQDL